MLNTVCEPEGSAAAVLIRALEPTRGIEAMRGAARPPGGRASCARVPASSRWRSGSASTSTARRSTAPPFEIRPRAGRWLDVEVATGPRIGITKATELPWRFCAAGSPFLSRPLPRAVASGSS